MQVNNVTLNNQTPSAIPSGQLYCWTKYSIGKRRGGNYRYGAVKPPNPAHDWFPAAISPDWILIASTDSFSTPEKAVQWLRAAG